MSRDRIGRDLLTQSERKGTPLQRRTRRHATWLIAALLILVTFVPVGRLTSTAHAETTDEVRTRLLGPGWDQPGVVRLKWITITVWLPCAHRPRIRMTIRQRTRCWTSGHRNKAPALGTSRG